MRILVVGGSGLVGSLVLPRLAAEHDVVNLDPLAPRYASGARHVPGTPADLPLLAEAAQGVDTLLFLAMGPKAQETWDEPETARRHLDISVSGLHLALRFAAEAGADHAVYASSMSAYEDFPWPQRVPAAAEPDATDWYGLGKRLGEQVLAAAVSRHRISGIALRLCWPLPDEDWQAYRDEPNATFATAGSDLCRAFLAAVARRGRGFEAVAISGDHRQRYVDLGAARELLGWSPQARR